MAERPCESGADDVVATLEQIAALYRRLADQNTTARPHRRQD
jgi:hypothetical protein